MSNPVINIGSTVASLAGVAVANKLLSTVWKQITGDEPPAKNPDPEESLRDTIIFTVISAAVGTMVKVGVARAAANLKYKEEIKNGGQEEI